MSTNNKRKMDKAQIDPTVEEKNIERNLRRRIAYREMAPEKKAALLERRRADYAARKRLHSQVSAATYSDQSCSSPEPRSKIPRQASIALTDTPSSSQNAVGSGVKEPSGTPANGQLNGCFTVFEKGSTSGACNEQKNLRQSAVIRGYKSTQTHMGCWNIKQLPDSPVVLKTVPNCEFCAARRFQYEPPAFCCSNGLQPKFYMVSMYAFTPELATTDV